jgi:hypothetical protein
VVRAQTYSTRALDAGLLFAGSRNVVGGRSVGEGALEGDLSTVSHQQSWRW